MFACNNYAEGLNTFKSSQWFPLSTSEVWVSRLLYHSMTLHHELLW